tara:strand:- start:482 stop:1063 length:582 start_codon:yes stop_codon:yes gene_type:complete
MQKIGLFFGTFDPIHKGHLKLINFFIKNSDVEFVWLIITPQSPFKEKKEIQSSSSRLELISIALKGNSKVKINTIELELTKPNYTYLTLRELKKKYPDNKFIILLGADNIVNFEKWKAYTEILENYELYIYPRKISAPIPNHFKNHPKINWINAPLIDASSTDIRNRIRNKKSISNLVPENVCISILDKKLYI